MRWCTRSAGCHGLWQEARTQPGRARTRNAAPRVVKYCLCSDVELTVPLWAWLNALMKAHRSASGWLCTARTHLDPAGKHGRRCSNTSTCRQHVSAGGSRLPQQQPSKSSRLFKAAGRTGRGPPTPQSLIRNPYNGGRKSYTCQSAAAWHATPSLIRQPNGNGDRCRPAPASRPPRASGSPCARPR